MRAIKMKFHQLLRFIKLNILLYKNHLIYSSQFSSHTKLHFYFNDRAVSHAEICLLCHAYKETRVDDSRNHLNGAIDFIKVCFR